MEIEFMSVDGKIIGTLIATFILAGCSVEPGQPSGRNALSEEGIAHQIGVLASDEFGGRAPFSEGERLTVEYIASEFAAAGLSPGNGDSYFQQTPLVSMTTNPDTEVRVAGPSGDDLALEFSEDVNIWTPRMVESVAIEDSEIIFVGYGIVAPEFGWNDYEGLDVRGKTVVILVNDPGYATEDPELFDGFSMTYYGRWTYKYEEAARQGAAMALIVHDTGPAGYGWHVVGQSNVQYDLVHADGNASRVAIEGWISQAGTRAVFEKAGLDFDILSAAALTGDFNAVPLNLRASVAVENGLVYADSMNVVGIIPGSVRPDEYFIYMAHWDHFGTDEALEGDKIYNGALDNASGTAALLELAQAYGSMEKAPERSILFLAVTAEERGLLGSAYYAANPLIPLNHTVAGLNMDGINWYGPTHDIVVTGYGASELDAVIEEVAAAQGRYVAPDPEPEKGYYFRSDHFELAKLGVPMIYPGSGTDMVVGGKEAGEAANAAYLADRYHKVTDEFDDSWVLSGALADVQLFFDVGMAVADTDTWPNWHQGNAFRAIRDASMEEGSE
jgi:Zn-dependent M28 family amino/carboxypeptidase